MTKSMKKIMAVALAVVMLALMIPFSASAAVGTTDVTFTVDTQDKADTFKFEIYQLATVDDNGAVTLNASVTDTAVQNAVKAAGNTTNTNVLIAACDASTGLGTAVTTWNDSNLSYTETLENGIYYVKPIATGSFSKANSSIVVVPVEDNANVALGEKVSTSPISLDKTITGVANGSTTKDTIGGNGEYASAGIGDTVTYTLTANVPGSADAQLKRFTILDTMDAGLTYKEVKSIKVDGADVSSDFTVTPNQDSATVGISLNKNGNYVVDSYYGKTVTVEITATVNENAVYASTDSNDNTMKLRYSNDSVTDQDVEGPTVQVFCFKLNLVKVDGANNATKLQGAEFKLEGNGITATGTTDANGAIDFGKQLSAGTYTLTETKAPADYVLNSTPISVVIGADYTSDNNADDPTYTATATTTTADATVSGDTVTITVKNTKITVPVTGGMGTAIFTICGASLIALAGVMFIVLKKKKASK